MKLEWNKKYTTIAVYSFLVLAAAVSYYLIVTSFDKIGYVFSGLMEVLKPILIGGAIAYLVNILLTFLENKILLNIKVFKKLKREKVRAIGVLLSYILIFTVFTGLMSFVLPQVVDSISGLAQKMPEYAKNLSETFLKTFENLKIDSKITAEYVKKLENFMSNIDKTLTTVVPKLGNFITGVMSGVTGFIIGIIFSIYMLLEKDKFRAQSKMVLYSLFSRNFANNTVIISKRMDNLMKKFLMSQILDAFIVAVTFFIILSFMGLEYVALMALILGITNIIPWLGPWLGSIPAAFIILLQSPVKTLWFILAVIIVQQIDGNIIAPKLQSDSLGISAFWVMFSIIIAGHLFGIIGMIIGIPFFVLFYSLFKEWIQARLRKKAMPDKTDFYLNEDFIEEE